MFSKFIEWVKRLFKKDAYSQEQMKRAAEDEAAYRRIDEINYTAIFSNSIANKVATGSTVDVVGVSRRADFVKLGIDNAWKNLRSLVQQAGGTGGKVLVPYIIDGEPLYSVIDQNRLVISKTRGERIVSATLVSEEVKVDNKKYYRLTDYELVGSTQIITNRAVDDGGAVVSLKQFFPNVQEQASIQNVDRLLFAYLKCPKDSREDNGLYGVPLTYGCEHAIAEIKEHLKLMAREFRATRVMLGLDPLMWEDEDARTTVQDDPDGLYKKLYRGGINNGQSAPWEIFSPAIRYTPMYDRLMQLYSDLEKEVGTSKGILTEQEAVGTTATAIWAGQNDTYSVVDGFRANISAAFTDLAYCFDVLAEYTGATPQGARDSYEINFDWDMKLYESSAETFQQMSALFDKGLLDGAKLNAWVTGQALEDAEKEVNEIAASKPTAAQIMMEEE